MSNTSITNLQISDTFQIWINKTNELIDLSNQNVMLAGPGSGFTVTGNSTLIGSFTANTITANTASATTLSITNLARSVDINESIISNSPVRITSGVENIFTLETTTGNRPILRMINGSNARWSVAHQGVDAGTALIVGTEGASTPQMTITQAGRVIASEFQGDGSNLTNLNAVNMSDGVFSTARIPNLDAAKITTGVFNVARVPDLDAAKITTGVLDVTRIPNLDAAKITTGVFNVARVPDLDAAKITTGVLDVTRIPNLDAAKITTGVFDDARLPSNIVRSSRTITAGTGLTGGGDFTSNRTISAVTLTKTQVENPSNTTFGSVSGLRLSESLTAGLIRDINIQTIVRALSTVNSVLSGTSIRARVDGEFIATSTSYVTRATFRFIQQGSVNLFFEARREDTTSVTTTAAARIRRTRDGVTSTVFSQTVSGTSYTAYDTNQNVLPGDVFTFQIRAGISGTGKNAPIRRSRIRRSRIRTSSDTHYIEI